MIVDLLSIGAKLLDKVIPDAGKAAEAKLALLTLHQNGELAVLNAETELAKGQLEVNKEEAKSDNIFKSGWRPFIGWVCGSAFAFNFFALPIIKVVCVMNGTPIEVPPLDMTEMMPVLLGLLGLGGLRTYERVKGKA